jgi:transposase
MKWKKRELRLLGTMSDERLGARLGLSTESVRLKRIELGIPAHRSKLPVPKLARGIPQPRPRARPIEAPIQRRLPREVAAKLDDAEWLRRAYQSRSSSQIAADLGVGRTTLQQALVKHRIPPKRSAMTTAAHAKLKDRRWLADKYQRMTVLEIAKTLRVSPPSVLRALRTHRIELRGPGRLPPLATNKKRYRPSTRVRLDKKTLARLDNAAWLKKQLETRNIGAIAKLLGVSEATVGRSLRRHGLKSHGQIPAEIQLKLDDASWLRERYERERKTTIDIARELDVGHSTVTKYLQVHGIAIRGMVRGPSRQRLERARAVHELRKLGLSYLEIGRKLRMSHETARQLDLLASSV